jgi:hypothetical protein
VVGFQQQGTQMVERVAQATRYVGFRLHQQIIRSKQAAACGSHSTIARSRVGRQISGRVLY